MKQFFLSVAAVFVFSAAILAQPSLVYVKDGAAIGGYDAVAYFTEGKPIKGDSTFKVTYEGASWFFASKENADKFKAAPEKYAPQYGGYCAFGCSRGYKAKTSPDAWTIVDGKLYLNYNTEVRETWNNDHQGYIQKADANWPKVKDTKYP